MPATALVQFAVSQRLGLGPVLLGTLAAGGVGATALGVASEPPSTAQPEAAAPMRAERVSATPAAESAPPVTPAIAASVAAPAMPLQAGRAIGACGRAGGCRDGGHCRPDRALGRRGPGTGCAGLGDDPAPVLARGPAPPAETLAPAAVVAQIEPVDGVVDDAPRPPLRLPNRCRLPNPG